MKNRTREEWRELFKQQTARDMSVAAFCKDHKVGKSYFYKRKSDLKVQVKQASSNFIKVKPSTNNHVQPQSIKTQPVVQADATTLKVIQEEKNKCYICNNSVKSYAVTVYYLAS
ncbi:MAG: hypothetical protein ACJAS9_003391 [Polaribacter sp.]|jgi:hypothetical protein